MKSFKNEKTLVEATNIQLTDGALAFTDIELESHKYKINTRKNKEFILMDERNPTPENLIRIEADEIDSKKVVFLKNTRNKRQLVNIMSLNQDNLHTMAIEGSTLTLMGLVKYNADTDCFEMT